VANFSYIIEEQDLLGCDALLYCTGLLTFRRNVGPPSSGPKMSEAINQQDANIRLLSLLHDTEYRGSMFLPKLRRTSAGLGLASQKIGLFPVTAERTSNSTKYVRHCCMCFILQLKSKLSLCLIKHHAMKTYGGVEA
jgi:hypothetical protein